MAFRTFSRTCNISSTESAVAATGVAKSIGKMLAIEIFVGPKNNRVLKKSPIRYFSYFNI